MRIFSWNHFLNSSKLLRSKHKCTETATCVEQAKNVLNHQGPMTTMSQVSPLQMIFNGSERRERAGKSERRIAHSDWALAGNERRSCAWIPEVKNLFLKQHIIVHNAVVLKARGYLSAHIQRKHNEKKWECEKWSIVSEVGRAIHGYQRRDFPTSQSGSYWSPLFSPLPPLPSKCSNGGKIHGAAQVEEIYLVEKVSIVKVFMIWNRGKKILGCAENVCLQCWWARLRFRPNLASTFPADFRSAFRRTRIDLALSNKDQGDSRENSDCGRKKTKDFGLFKRGSKRRRRSSRLIGRLHGGALIFCPDWVVERTREQGKVRERWLHGGGARDNGKVREQLSVCGQRRRDSTWNMREQRHLSRW